jgi:hypothetical protein
MTRLLRILAIVLLVSVAAHALLATLGIERNVKLPPSAMAKEEGQAFLVAIPNASHLATAGDTNENPTASSARVLEDGRELGPGHTIHSNIRQEGRGRFSHWHDQLYFSSSDGSDPRTNGRAYSVRARYYIVPDDRYFTSEIALFVALLALSGWQHGRGRWARGASAAKELVAPRNLVRIACLTLAYALALVLIDAAVAAQKQHSGGFKINFEYKVF